MKVAVAIIVLSQSHVLLIRSRKRPGSVEIPGGGLRAGEGIFDGAERELREETGLRVAPSWRNLVPVDRKEVDGWRVHILQALRWRGELVPGDDASECWFGPPDSILEGQRPEDYPIVLRAMRQQPAVLGR
jgi:8-oxo-dGTP pyrophosphatase MutT (NUDIX family)